MKAFLTELHTDLLVFLLAILQRKERNADMTIGDFWGLKSKKITDINKGVSLVQSIQMQVRHF